MSIDFKTVYGYLEDNYIYTEFGSIGVSQFKNSSIRYNNINGWFLLYRTIYDNGLISCFTIKDVIEDDKKNNREI